VFSLSGCGRGWVHIATFGGGQPVHRRERCTISASPVGLV
jgi:hypothetical protein